MTLALHKVFNPYSCIHFTCLLGDTLDVGAGNLSAQLHSTNFPLVRYGLDVGKYLPLDLPDDVRTYETEQKFDTILCLQMMAYIPQRHWKALFLKFKNWLKPNGVLIIAATYDRNKEHTINTLHQTFNIRPEMFQNFFPGAKFQIVRGQRRMFPRWGFKKMLRHMLVRNGKHKHLYLHGSKALFMIWKKKEGFH